MAKTKICEGFNEVAFQDERSGNTEVFWIGQSKIPDIPTQYVATLGPSVTSMLCGRKRDYEENCRLHFKRGHAYSVAIWIWEEFLETHQAISTGNISQAETEFAQFNTLCDNGSPDFWALHDAAFWCIDTNPAEAFALLAVSQWEASPEDAMSHARLLRMMSKLPDLPNNLLLKKKFTAIYRWLAFSKRACSFKLTPRELLPDGRYEAVRLWQARFYRPHLVRNWSSVERLMLKAH